MSDGNTVYFSVTNTCDADGNKNEMYLTNGNGSQIYYQDDIYSVNIDGSNLEKVFSADHEIFLLAITRVAFIMLIRLLKTVLYRSMIQKANLKVNLQEQKMRTA